MTKNKEDRIWVGIDPGKTGAVAILDESGWVDFHDFQDPPTAGKKLRCANKRWRIQLACLEKVHAFREQGVVSGFNFGANFGMWEGILCALDIPYRLITPKTWQKGMLTKADGLTPEKQALKVARGLFPKAELHLAKHKDRACALLMAYYGKTKC
jgi:hypothetical protein